MAERPELLDCTCVIVALIDRVVSSPIGFRERWIVEQRLLLALLGLRRACRFRVRRRRRVHDRFVGRTTSTTAAARGKGRYCDRSCDLRCNKDRQGYQLGRKFVHASLLLCVSALRQLAC